MSACFVSRSCKITVVSGSNFLLRPIRFKSIVSDKCAPFADNYTYKLCLVDCDLCIFYVFRAHDELATFETHGLRLGEVTGLDGLP